MVGLIMNREIKYRGMDIVNEWHFGLLSISQGKKGQPEKGYYISNQSGNPWAYQIKPDTLSEYTGIDDKDNNDIYESDICRFYNSDSAFGFDYIALIEYQYGAFCIRRKIDKGNDIFLLPLAILINSIIPCTIEIIGNKYQNPVFFGG